MPHTPERKAAERPVKAATIDRREAKKAHTAHHSVSRPKPMKPAQMARADRLGIKQG